MPKITAPELFGLNPPLDPEGDLIGARFDTERLYVNALIKALQGLDILESLDLSCSTKELQQELSTRKTPQL